VTLLKKDLAIVYYRRSNSAGCKRGFSNLGWLFNERRLNLNLDRLESMAKMIMLWKSNARTELGFYGVEKNGTRIISDAEMNIRIAEALAETDDDECNVLSNESLPHQITVPPDNCVVLIDHIWIDNFIDLSHELVINKIGEIPANLLEDDSEEHEENSTDDDETEERGEGRGVYNYNIDDLLDSEGNGDE
jgi:hypothetical protein